MSKKKNLIRLDYEIKEKFQLNFVYSCFRYFILNILLKLFYDDDDESLFIYIRLLFLYIKPHTICD